MGATFPAVTYRYKYVGDLGSIVTAAVPSAHLVSIDSDSYVDVAVPKPDKDKLDAAMQQLGFLFDSVLPPAPPDLKATIDAPSPDIWAFGSADSATSMLAWPGAVPTKLEWLENESRGRKVLEITHLVPTVLFGGVLAFAPTSQWEGGDLAELSLLLPATVVTPNAGSGSCKLINTGKGFSTILPAAGDGDHDVDLSTAVPVPVEEGKIGEWAVDQVTGNISSALGSGKYHLLDTTMEIAGVRVGGIHPSAGAQQQSYVIFASLDTPVKIHPSWKVHFSVTKKSAGPGTVSVWAIATKI